jgi:hypothetical protein
MAGTITGVLFFLGSISLGWLLLALGVAEPHSTGASRMPSASHTWAWGESDASGVQRSQAPDIQTLRRSHPISSAIDVLVLSVSDLSVSDVQRPPGMIHGDQQRSSIDHMFGCISASDFDEKDELLILICKNGHHG